MRQLRIDYASITTTDAEHHRVWRQYNISAIPRVFKFLYRYAEHDWPDKWRVANPAPFYRKGFIGPQGAHFSAGTTAKQGLRLALPGRWWERYGSPDMEELVLNSPCRLTRLDIRMDSIAAPGAQRYWDILSSAEASGNAQVGTIRDQHGKVTVYVGNRKTSGMYVRIYDREVVDEDGVIEEGVRLEVELKGDFLTRRVPRLREGLWTIVPDIMSQLPGLRGTFLGDLLTGQVTEQELVPLESLSRAQERQRWFEKVVRPAIYNWFEEDPAKAIDFWAEHMIRLEKLYESDLPF